MANILILGGGFGGVVAAESLAKQVDGERQITLVSRVLELGQTDSRAVLVGQALVTQKLHKA